MDAIGRQIVTQMTHGSLGSEKQGFYPDPLIRVLPLDPMGGDEVPISGILPGISSSVICYTSRDELLLPQIGHTIYQRNRVLI